MKRLSALMASLMALPMLLLAQTARAESIDQMIREIAQPVADAVVPVVFYGITIGSGDDAPSLLLIVVWLIVMAVVCTVYFGFIQFRKFKLAIDIVRGKYTDPNDPGEVSHFQALATALSGTVGLGNIAGVAVAISIGGPGATLWMILAGFLGMATKFAECTLGVKYRVENPDGSVSGGPMYYLPAGMKERGWGGLGKVLGVLSAILVIFGALGGGNMFQSNQATALLLQTIQYEDANKYVIGLVFAFAVGAVIIGGIKSIAKVTEKIVPAMAGIYLVSCLAILLINFDQIGAAFGAIITGAFSPEAGLGGILGVLIQGFKRAAFSNEAGVGSAPIAHSAVKTKEPTTEGLVALLEPFIDTVVICTMTALVIIITGTYVEGELGGVGITAAAFNSVFPGFDIILTIAVVLFAYSTMLSWSYYGLKGWTYLFGESTQIVFKVIFCSFAVIGSAMSLGPVIDLSDAAIFSMAFVNILGLYFLLPIVKEEANDFFLRVKNGSIKRYD